MLDFSQQQLLEAIKNKDSIENLAGIMAGFAPLVADSIRNETAVSTLSSREFADENGNSPLHWAVFLRNYEVADFLLKNGFGSGLMMRNQEGLTPIHLLLTRDEASQSVATKPASLGDRIKTWWSPLPASEGQALISLSASEATLVQTSALDDAALKRFILLLIDAQHAPVPAQDKFGFNVLHSLCIRNDEDFIRWFVEHAPNYGKHYLIQTEVTGRNPLHVACGRASFALIEFLMQATVRPLGEEAIASASSYSVTDFVTQGGDSSFHKEQKYAMRSKRNVGLGMFAGGATVGLVATIGGAAAFFIFPPLMIPALVIAMGGVGVELVGGLAWNVNTARHINYNDLKFQNLLHFIAGYNTSAVLTEFLQKMPASFLKECTTEISLVEKLQALRYAPGAMAHHNVSAVVGTRHRSDPQAMDVDTFNTLLRAQTCYYEAYQYFVGKYEELQKDPSVANNVETRLSDFCKCLTKIMEFFVANKDKVVAAADFDRYCQQFREGTQAETSKAAIQGSGRYFSQDRYLQRFRENILQAPVATAVYRIGELCDLFNAVAATITDLDQVSAEQAVAFRLRTALLAGGAEVDCERGASAEMLALPTSFTATSTSL